MRERGSAAGDATSTPPPAAAEPAAPGRPRFRRRLRGSSALDARLAAIGVIGGVLSGLLGVGGGVIMVPLLVLWVGYGQRAAHAMSLGAIIPISVAGVATYGVAGEVQVPEAAALAVGAILGAQVGAGVLARVNERVLKLVFGLFLVAVAAAMVIEP